MSVFYDKSTRIDIVLLLSEYNKVTKNIELDPENHDFRQDYIAFINKLEEEGLIDEFTALRSMVRFVHGVK